MEKHADRFTGRVDNYEKYRLRYPAIVLDVLRERCNLTPADHVADIGAGTGMLAELFLAAGNPVIAIEPNAEMRAACTRLISTYPAFKVIASPAEATTLADASIDLIAVGRAFHWFDRSRALAEFQRILKPGRWVVLVSARRASETSDQGRDFDAILAEHGIDYSAVRGDLNTIHDLKPYGENPTFNVRIPGAQYLTLEQFLGQTQSLSVTPMPGHPGYAAMQQALRGLFTHHSQNNILTLETSTDITAWQTPA